MTKLTRWVNFSRTLQKFKNKIVAKSAPIEARSRKIYTRTLIFVENRPLTSFAILLAILLLLIVAGKILQTPQVEVQPEIVTKEVEVFKIGTSPTLRVSAQIEKSQVVQIVAQTAGIVQKINVYEGIDVSRGTTLISLSNNYLGSNVASLQRQLATAQYQNVLGTYDLQKDLINKQRDIAQKTNANAADLRNITQQSLDDTRSLISLNDEIVSSLDKNIANLEATNVGGANDALILQTKELKAQLLAGQNQARATLRSSDYSSNGSNAPAQLSDLQKDIALKQLDLQEKMLNLNKETSLLQLKIAQVNESLMFPAAPFNGRVERVHVIVGQSVSPGTPLITFAGSSKTAVAVALVPRNIAASVSKLSPSTLKIDTDSIDVTPTYISQEATSGQLYSVIYEIPQNQLDRLTNKSYVDIDIPIGYNFTTNAAPFIPLDAIHQTQEKSIIYVASGDRAKSREVTLGEVEGKYIQVASGLDASDLIIISRNVTDNDKIKIKST